MPFLSWMSLTFLLCLLLVFQILCFLLVSCHDSGNGFHFSLWRFMFAEAVGFAFLYIMSFPVLRGTRFHIGIQIATGANTALCTQSWINLQAMAPSSFHCSHSFPFIPASWVIHSTDYTSVWTGHSDLFAILVCENCYHYRHQDLFPSLPQSIQITAQLRLWSFLAVMCSKPLLEQGCLEPAVFNCVQSSAEYLWRQTPQPLWMAWGQPPWQ